MAYDVRIGTSTPGLIMILVDQSSSMTVQFGGQTRAEGAAMAVNRLIEEIGTSCQSGSGYKDRCFVGVIGYGSTIQPTVAGMISQVMENPIRVEKISKKVSDGAGGLVETDYQMPIWLEPRAYGGTPMAEALQSTYDFIQQQWLPQHQNSFPPVVINITDGQPNDMTRTAQAAQQVMSLRSDDGNTLLLNAHISGGGGEVKLPNNERDLSDNYARFLFNISSVLPDKLRSAAQNVGLSPQPGSRGFVFNAGVETMIKLLTFGSTGALN